MPFFICGWLRELVKFFGGLRPGPKLTGYLLMTFIHLLMLATTTTAKMTETAKMTKTAKVAKIAKMAKTGKMVKTGKMAKRAETTEMAKTAETAKIGKTARRARRANSNNLLAFLKNKDQGRVSSDFYDSFPE